MGIVHKGIHKELALELAKKYKLTNFVETGTHVGATAKWASKHFKQVYTLECNDTYLLKARASCEGINNIKFFHGASDTSLFGQIIDRLKEPTLFWLDAHWSRDLVWKRPIIICPVLAEILTINRKIKVPHAIMVDDYRLFGEQKGWPSFKMVEKALSERRVYVDSDVIVGEPE